MCYANCRDIVIVCEGSCGIWNIEVLEILYFTLIHVHSLTYVGQTSDCPRKKVTAYVTTYRRQLTSKQGSEVVLECGHKNVYAVKKYC